MAEPTSDADASARTAADWVADLCVYAPIGFILDAHKYLPEFAERGRSQVAMARFVGKFAVGRLEKQFGPVLDGASGPLRSFLDALGVRGPSAPPTDGAGPVPAPGPGAEIPEGGAGHKAHAEGLAAVPDVAAEGLAAVPDVAAEGVDDGPGAAAPAAAAARATASRPRSSTRSGSSARGASAGRSGSAARGASASQSAPSVPSASSGRRGSSSRRASARRGASAGRSGAATTGARPARAKRPASADSAGTVGGGVAAEAASADPGPVAVPVEADLAIPQYSTLAASQVVPRLASLDVHELAAIRRFESDHRGRRTILNRVDQLLARSG